MTISYTTPGLTIVASCESNGELRAKLYSPATWKLELVHRHIEHEDVRKLPETGAEVTTNCYPDNLNFGMGSKQGGGRCGEGDWQRELLLRLRTLGKCSMYCVGSGCSQKIPVAKYSQSKRDI